MAVLAEQLITFEMVISDGQLHADSPRCMFTASILFSFGCLISLDGWLLVFDKLCWPLSVWNVLVLPFWNFYCPSQSNLKFSASTSFEKISKLMNKRRFSSRFLILIASRCSLAGGQEIPRNFKSCTQWNRRWLSNLFQRRQKLVPRLDIWLFVVYFLRNFECEFNSERLASSRAFNVDMWSLPFKI